MSIQFPKRSDWLAFRNQPPRPVKYSHVSKALQYVYNKAHGTVETIVKPGPGTTFKLSRREPSRRDKIRAGAYKKRFTDNIIYIR